MSQTNRDDWSILKEHFEFVPDERSSGVGEEHWGKRMAQRYSQKLHKEYALLEFGPDGRVGLRWRTEEEVARGKGQFMCGNKRCSRTDELKSHELHFRYQEAGAAKDELVKVRLCPSCRDRLSSSEDKERRAGATDIKSGGQGKGTHNASESPGKPTGKRKASGAQGSPSESARQKQPKADKEIDEIIADILK